MNRTALLTSFFEIGPDLGARVGAADFDEVVERNPLSPSVLICIAEPALDAVQFRLRFGTAMVTDEGVVHHLPDDEAERRGAWAGSLGYAFSAIALLKLISSAEIEALLGSAPPKEWFHVILERQLLRPLPTLRPFFSSDRAGETFVRLRGGAHEIAELLVRVYEQTQEIEG